MYGHKVMNPYFCVLCLLREIVNQITMAEGVILDFHFYYLKILRIF